MAAFALLVVLACARGSGAQVSGAALLSSAAPSPSVPSPIVLDNPFPASARAYLVDVGGVPRWGVNIAQPLPVASLGKMMSALLIADALHGADPVVVVSPNAARSGGARLGLRAGERMLASALLAAMLVRSANDACVALAEWQAGSAQAFVARMNARAQALGLADTHFVDACGFDALAQHASARDLLVMARELLARPRLAALVARETMAVATVGGRHFALRNTNALLGRVPGVVGVKTGYTHDAGTCVVIAAERNGRRVLVVLLGAADRWWDAAAMIERAFDSVRTADARTH